MSKGKHLLLEQNNVIQTIIENISTLSHCLIWPFQIVEGLTLCAVHEQTVHTFQVYFPTFYKAVSF